MAEVVSPVPGAGRREPGGGEGGGAGGPRSSWLCLLGRRTGPCPGASGPGKLGGGVGVPSFRPCPEYTQVTTQQYGAGGHPAPSRDPSPEARVGVLRHSGWGKVPARPGGAVLLSQQLGHSPRVGGGLVSRPRAGRQGQGEAGRKLPHKEDSVPHMDRIKVPGSAPR